MSVLHEKRRALLALSHTLGAEHRHLAILGEGNASAKLSDHTFLVKASGSNLGTLREEEVVECRFDVLLPLLDLGSATYEAIDETLFGCRIHPEAKKPSVEALFHALLLSLPGINFVGHTHPVAVNSILCSPLGETFATHRMCPDEVICCGEASVFVPYFDPGLRLSQAIRERTNRFIEQQGALPRVILLQNHGLITLGATSEAVEAATFMTVKAAHIFAGASALGGPNFLSFDQIDSLANRRDEHYRQRALNL
jgi:rhamnose utilization protein RhaD (predicted bifunctional aldolase and dehydrogenase)